MPAVQQMNVFVGRVQALAWVGHRKRGGKGTDARVVNFIRSNYYCVSGRIYM